jgi:hypothetical protein
MAKRKKTTGDEHRRKADAAIVDHVCDVMHTMCRDMTIDKLLCHPFRAIVMAVEVGRRSTFISDAAAERLVKAMRKFETDSPDHVEAINLVCNTALNARKHGDIKRDRH